MNDEASLAGKTAVVLGGSRPYGAAVARMLAREGVNVALGGRSRQVLEDLEAEIRASGGEALVVGTHLAKRHHPAHLVEAAGEAFGGLDALIFMVRVCAPPLASADLDAWERSVDVNIKGFLYCLAAALPMMRGEGHVVSLNATDPRDRQDPLYGAGAAAVRSLLRGLAAELSGVRATEIALGDRRRAAPEACAEVVQRALLHGARERVGGFETLTVAQG